MSDAAPSGPVRGAPKQLLYAEQVPLAVPASSQRREFIPNNGTVFTYEGSNIINLELNSDSYLDTAHSFLQATVTNTSAAGSAGQATNLAPDFGPAWIQKIDILSAGVLLESIDEYGKIHATLMAASDDQVHKQGSVNYNQNMSIKATIPAEG